MIKALSLDELSHEAHAEGLQLVSVSPKLRLDASEIARLKSWQEAGHAGEMGYMERSVEERVDARHFEGETACLLSFAIPYTASREKEKLPPGYGRVARYALGKDYHRVIKKRLQKLRERLQIDQKILWRPITDSFPLLERAFAVQAGIGFVGKNTMVIRRKLGSFFFLGEVLTSISLRLNESLSLYEGNCGSCSNCLTSCPTNAFPKPYELDARRCISYLTIEKRGAFEEWESEALGEWVFGCDICQEVCPFNYQRRKNDSFPIWEEFHSLSGGEYGALNLVPLFELTSDDEFREAFSGRAILRAGREGMLRNALSVLGNSRDSDSFSKIADRALSDSSGIVRGEAERTAQKFL